MSEQFELIAKTFMGLEHVLANELTALGAGNVKAGRRMVSFTGDKEMMYRANFQLHTALRILKPIRRFKARSAEDVYEEIKKVDWDRYILPGKTFAVDSVVYSDEFRNSRFVTYKVKDAIVDQFRERTGTRPNISVSNPDIRLHIHIAEDDATLCLDSSGDSLHRRGYRQESVEAPLNEVLAAGMILITGWQGECDFIDPMCGSGTLLVEADLIARNISPGVFRKEFAFEKWPDFDQDLFDTIYNDDSKEREFNHHIYGYDIDPKAVATARTNVRAAGLSKDITLAMQDFKDFTKPQEKSIIVTNPPYGERISTPNLLATYKMIGERLKREFSGNVAWVLSYREECFEQIGLKPSIKIPLYNGSLECEFRKYTLFEGRMSDFRAEGGIVKTEEEKEEMAQKHRFKKNREFKQRLNGEESNEEGDIRTFQFHKFPENDDRFSDERRPRRFDDERHPKRFDDERRSRFDERRRMFGDGRKPSRFGGDRDDRSADDRGKRFGGDRGKRFGDDRGRRFGGDRQHSGGNGYRDRRSADGRNGGKFGQGKRFGGNSKYGKNKEYEDENE